MRIGADADRGRLIAVAQGIEKADCFLEKGQLLNVYSGELLMDQNVALAGDRIAYVGPSRSMVGDNTKIINCQGRTLVPGYVDAHAHADFLTNPLALSDALVPLGTTAINSYSEDIAGSLGLPGLEYYFDISADLPLKIFLELSATIPPDPRIDGPDRFPAPVLEKLLFHPRVLSLGELYAWTKVLDRDAGMLEKIELFRKHGFPVDGHTAGARDEKLNALVASGFSSCHEATNAEEMLQQLRLGLYVFLRHGSVRRDLDAFLPLIKERIDSFDTSRLVLVPDWMSPADIISRGYLDSLIKEAIEAGLPPILAYRMATVNPAMYLGLGQELGGIAPGRKADILLLTDLMSPTPETVIANGQVVAWGKKMITPANEKLQEVPGLNLEMLGCSLTEVSPNHFAVRAGEKEKYITFPVIHIHSKTITLRKDERLPVNAGTVIMPENSNLLKISVPDALGTGFSTGFLSGFGAAVGGMATSIGFNCKKLIVIGKNETDMAQAFHRLLAIGGGVVIVEGGKEEMRLELPFGGIASLKSVAELAREIQGLGRYLRTRGCTLEDPLLTIRFLTFSWLPQVRISSRGVLDVKTREMLFQSKF